MTENHTRYRATITSMGMVPFHVRGSNLAALRQRVYREACGMQAYWRAPLTVTIAMTDIRPGSVHQRRLCWQPVTTYTYVRNAVGDWVPQAADDEMPSPWCSSQPDHERTDMEI